MSQCSYCNTYCAENIAVCDMCRRRFCQNCAAVTNVEWLAIISTPRTIIYYCRACLRDLPHPSAKINSPVMERFARHILDTVYLGFEEKLQNINSSIIELNNDLCRKMKDLSYDVNLIRISLSLSGMKNFNIFTGAIQETTNTSDTSVPETSEGPTAHTSITDQPIAVQPHDIAHALALRRASRNDASSLNPAVNNKSSKVNSPRNIEVSGESSRNKDEVICVHSPADIGPTDVHAVVNNEPSRGGDTEINHETYAAHPGVSKNASDIDLIVNKQVSAVFSSVSKEVLSANSVLKSEPVPAAENIGIESSDVHSVVGHKLSSVPPADIEKLAILPSINKQESSVHLHGNNVIGEESNSHVPPIGEASAIFLGENGNFVDYIPVKTDFFAAKTLGASDIDPTVNNETLSIEIPAFSEASIVYQHELYKTYFAPPLPNNDNKKQFKRINKKSSCSGLLVPSIEDPGRNGNRACSLDATTSNLAESKPPTSGCEKIDVYVSRFPQPCTIDSVFELLDDELPVLSCVQLNSGNHSEYASFKVTIYKKDIDVVMDPALWPTGVCIHKSFPIDPMKNRM